MCTRWISWMHKRNMMRMMDEMIASNRQNLNICWPSSSSIQITLKASMLLFSKEQGYTYLICIT
jgi:hypothetical protein